MGLKRFYRGVAVQSREKAIQAGLSVLNEPPLFPIVGASSHGGFFYVDKTVIDGRSLYSIGSAEDWAKYVADRDGKMACVIDLSLDRQNREILQGRIFKATIVSGRRGDVFDFDMVDVHRDLEDLCGIVTINLSGLTHEELMKLNINVGFARKNEPFEYNLYKEWTNILGIRKEIREGQPDLFRFGRPRPWRV